MLVYYIVIGVNDALENVPASFASEAAELKNVGGNELLKLNHVNAVSKTCILKEAFSRS